MLESIGMVWDVYDYIWEQNYHAAVQYYKKHGNLNIPKDYLGSTGKSLSRWLVARRKKYHDGALTKEQMMLLKSWILSANNLRLNRFQLITTS